MADFRAQENQRLIAWKQRTPTLPDAARAPGRYVTDGEETGDPLPICLPAEYAQYNLLPDARDDALAYFAANKIAWHAPTAVGPSNHLRDSQVQCVHALGAAAHDPDRVAAAFGGVVDIGEMLTIEPGRYVAFEYIGDCDYLNEVKGARTRGTMTTSADAAIRYRTSTGEVEIALIEWKYTELYKGPLSPDRNNTRRTRCQPFWDSPTSPLRTDLIAYDDMFVEPFYQLMRQQFLAHEMEQAKEQDAAAVRVIHVSPHDNAALRASLRDAHRVVGDDVFDVWKQILLVDRFVSLDSGVFIDADLTSADYVDRYGPIQEVA